jgi:hypothetical protein
MSDLTVGLIQKLVNNPESQRDLGNKEKIIDNTLKSKISNDDHELFSKTASPNPSNISSKSHHSRFKDSPKSPVNLPEEPTTLQKFSTLNFDKVKRSAETVRAASRLIKKDPQKKILTSIPEPINSNLSTANSASGIRTIPKRPTSLIQRLTHTLLYGGKNIIEILLEPLINLLSSKKIARRRALLQILTIKKQVYSDKIQQIKNLNLSKITKNLNANNRVGVQDLKFEETEKKQLEDLSNQNLDVSNGFGIENPDTVMPYYNQVNTIHFDDNNGADSLSLLIMPIISPIRKKLRKKNRKKKITRD